MKWEKEEPIKSSVSRRKEIIKTSYQLKIEKKQKLMKSKVNKNKINTYILNTERRQKLPISRMKDRQTPQMLKGYKHYAHKFDNLKEIDQLLERHKL